MMITTGSTAGMYSVEKDVNIDGYTAIGIVYCSQNNNSQTALAKFGVIENGTAHVSVYQHDNYARKYDIVIRVIYLKK